MRFLVDECTGPAVARWLRDQSHEVFSVYEEARGTADDDVLEANARKRPTQITNRSTGVAGPVGIKWIADWRRPGQLGRYLPQIIDYSAATRGMPRW